MGRILFILPALPNYEPYVYNYFKITEEQGLGYDVICWDRKGENSSFPDNYYVYSRQTNDSFPPFRKVRDIFWFSVFVRKILRKKKYSFVFTFTIADSIFYARFLSRHYRKRFVFDIRDFSPIITNSIFRRELYILLRDSACNVISSKGYLKWLPKQFEYLVCHNTNIDSVYESIYNHEGTPHHDSITILTIGAIRDVLVNQRVIDAFANKDRVSLQFVGEGNGASVLSQYCVKHRIKNVSFHGRYEKKDEDELTKACSLINIMLLHTVNSDSAMANRFYLSARLRKPMIVNSGCFQADQVEKYGLGLVVSESDDLYQAVWTYWNSLDWESYNERCSVFLQDVYEEMKEYKNRMVCLLKGV